MERGRARAPRSRGGRASMPPTRAPIRASRPTTTSIRRAQDMGMRVLIDLAPDAPRWATAGAPRISAETVNRRPDPARVRATSPRAVAKRYSGDYRGPAARSMVLDLERAEPLPLPEAGASARPDDLPRDGRPRRCRGSGRRTADAQVLVGETAAVGKPGHRRSGPREFVQRWLCLDDALPADRTGGCARLQPLDVDGFAHHPYGPAERVPRKKDIVSLLVIRRLGRYLDRAARAGRAARRPADLQHRVRAAEQPARSDGRQRRSRARPRC